MTKKLSERMISPYISDGTWAEIYDAVRRLEELEKPRNVGQLSESFWSSKSLNAVADELYKTTENNPRHIPHIYRSLAVLASNIERLEENSK